MRAARLLVPVTVLALLGGCAAAQADEPDPAPVADHSEPRRSKVLSDDTDRDAHADGPADSSQLAACLQGTWELEHESLEELTAAGLGGASDTTVEVTGVVTMTIGPTTVTTRYDDYTQATTIQDGPTLLGVTTRHNGETVAPYSLDRDSITTEGAEVSDVTIESSTFINGVEVDYPEVEGLAQLGADMSAATGSTDIVTCSERELVLVPVVAGTTMSGLAITATRR